MPMNTLLEQHFVLLCLFWGLYFWDFTLKINICGLHFMEIAHLIREIFIFLREESVALHEKVLGTAQKVTFLHRHARWEGVRGLSDGSSRSHREEGWYEGCGTESGSHHPTETSARRQSSQQPVLHSESRQIQAHLGADTQVRIWHEFRLPVWVFLRLHVGVGHADTDARDGQDRGQYLPGPGCEEQAATEASAGTI